MDQERSKFARRSRSIALHAINLHVWVGAAAALLGAATFELRGAPIDFAVVAFAGFATALVYSTPFVRLRLAGPIREPNVRQVWILAHLRVYFASYALIAIATASSFVALSAHERLRLALPVAAAIAYVVPLNPWRRESRSLRDVPLLKDVWIAGLWWCLTFDLPVASLGELAAPSWGVEQGLERFLFVFVLALVFDARDREDDLRQGLITIPTVLGRRGALALGVASTILSVWLSRDLYFLRGGIAFVVGACSTIAVCIAALKKPGWYFYTGVVDGVMILEPLCLIALRRWA